MPVIVEMKNCHIVLADEVQFVLQGWVVFDVFGVILMQVEGRFMGNYHVFTRGGSPFHDVQCRHHGGGNTAHGGALTSGDDLIDGLRAPGNSHLLADAVHYVASGQWRRCSFCLCQVGSERGAACENEVVTGKIVHGCSSPRCYQPKLHQDESS